MTRDEIIIKIKALQLPLGGYVVFGSSPLAVAGLRESDDIDMLVSEEVYASLQQAGWQQIDKGYGDEPLTYDVFEADKTWNFTSYSPKLEHLLKTADIIDGVPFASLEEVRKWKSTSGRPKDSHDVELIDAYLSKADTTA
jgi:hypothetical protein